MLVFMAKSSEVRKKSKRERADDAPGENRESTGSKPAEKSVSLSPLKFEEAVKGLFGVRRQGDTQE